MEEDIDGRAKPIFLRSPCDTYVARLHQQVVMGRRHIDMASPDRLPIEPLVAGSGPAHVRICAHADCPFDASVLPSHVRRDREMGCQL